MQGNDPKHTSNMAKEWMEGKSINWWKTPAESPDLNPIENLSHELKEYIRREVKPKVKEELIDGIQQFWGTVDQAKCEKYIGHLQKVIPKVIELEGSATGYSTRLYYFNTSYYYAILNDLTVFDIMA
jgi:hypothetical protein